MSLFFTFLIFLGSSVKKEISKMMLPEKNSPYQNSITQAYIL